jgi:hypothetical protein
MREHLEHLMTGLAESLRREHRRTPRRRGPRRARGTYVPAASDAGAMRLAH